MTHWHDSLTCVTWLIDICDMTHWNVGHVLCISGQTSDASSEASSVWHDSLICVTWLIDMCDMTHWYVWHRLLLRVTWLIDMWDMTHWHVRHDSFTCETWLIKRYLRQVVCVYVCVPCVCVLQRVTNVLQCVAVCWVCCSVLQCVAVYISVLQCDSFKNIWAKLAVNQTLQHTATHCNTLQHTVTHCNTLQHTAAHCNTLQHTATHCNTLQHTATPEPSWPLMRQRTEVINSS